jgi:hypothetical protein
MVAEWDKSLPLHSIQMTQHARLRDFINHQSAQTADIQNSYRITFDEILGLQKRRCTLISSVPAKDRATFYIAYSVALSYGLILSTIMLRSVEGFKDQLAHESAVLVEETLAVSEAAAEFIPLGSSTMSSLLLAAWPNNPSCRPVIERWLQRYQGGFPIVRWLETAQWLDELLYPSTNKEVALYHRRSRPADACIVM